MKLKRIIKTEVPQELRWELIDGKPTLVFVSEKVLTQEDKDKLFREVFDLVDEECPCECHKLDDGNE